jgi:class 3 adenylate cyclase
MPWVISAFTGGADGGGASQTTASEASSAARTVRLLRVVRLVRLVRLVKLYKYFMEKFFHKEGEEKVAQTEVPSWQDNPSAVGRALQESITLQVVVGVLLMLMVFPLISVTEQRVGFDYDVELVEQVDRLWHEHKSAGSASAAAAARQLVVSAVGFQELVYFEAYDGSVLLEDSLRMPPAIRWSEFSIVSAGLACAEGGESCSVGGFFKRNELIIQAQYSLGLLAFVIVLLVSGVLVFNRIATRYCIAPIEKLFALVNSFAKDPMAKLDSFGDDAVSGLQSARAALPFPRPRQPASSAHPTRLLRAWRHLGALGSSPRARAQPANRETLRRRSALAHAVQMPRPAARAPSRSQFCPTRSRRSPSRNPTRNCRRRSFASAPAAHAAQLEELNELEQSIRKIASLLQVGIGLAGRETIARCLRTTGDINPIAVGIKVNCLFGFCDIRQFTDATECLQEQVMLFTNSVGHIVHHSVHDCGGFANKNIGDAFLVAWTGDKLERRIAQVRHSDRNKQIGAVFADNDLELAARDKWTPTVGDQAMASFIRLTICVRGATHITELVQNPVLQKRLPGYTVRLGCGLHVGWAIEGALGTQKKIDATYLSPATNIAMGLEGATKQYGNLLLVSQETFKLFSPFVQRLVRRIDRVWATAGADAFDLYTYDCPTSLSVHPDEANDKAMVQHVFDYPLAITKEFRERFERGLDFYLQASCVRRRARFPLPHPRH